MKERERKAAREEGVERSVASREALAEVGCVTERVVRTPERAAWERRRVVVV